MAGTTPRVTVLVILIVLALIAGCVGVLPGDNGTAPGERASEDRQSRGDGTTMLGREISVMSLNYRTNNSTPVVQADISLQFRGGEPVDRFENATICLYDTDGTVLYENITSFTPPVDRKERSIPLSEIPAYLVVDHPEFHGSAGFDWEFVKFERGTDGTPERDNQDELSALPFEYPRHNETGRCM